MRTSRSRSRSPPIPQFPLILCFQSNLFTEKQESLKLDIIKKFNIDRVHISDEVSMNDLQSRLVYLYSPSMRAKFESLKFIFDSVFTSKSTSEAIICFQNLIDPGILIRSVSRSFQGNLQALPDIKGYPERMIKVSGKSGDVERAIKDMHSFCLDKKPSPEPKLSNIDKNGAKFVVPEDILQMITGRGGVFFKRLKADFEVEVKIIKANGPPCRDNDHILIVFGRHRHVRRCLKSMVKQIIECCEISPTVTDQTLRMLILSSHVKELIGPQGSIIKDISKKAGNAKIKVLSDSETEKNQEFTIVNIDGSNEAKQEAASKVYELLGKSDKASPKLSPEEEELKIFVSVPDQYVARLIGRNGENVKAIMKSAKCKISFQKAPASDIRFNEGEKIRMCYVSGNSSSIAKGVKLLLEQISKLEAS